MSSEPNFEIQITEDSILLMQNWYNSGFKTTKAALIIENNLNYKYPHMLYPLITISYTDSPCNLSTIDIAFSITKNKLDRLRSMEKEELEKVIMKIYFDTIDAVKSSKKSLFN